MDIFNKIKPRKIINNELPNSVWSVLASPGENLLTSVNISFHSQKNNLFLLLTTTDDKLFLKAQKYYPETVLFSFSDDEKFNYSGFDKPRYFNQISITNLTPKTNYIYKIIGDNIQSLYKFSTPCLNELTFLLVADPQYYNYETSKHFNQLISKARQLYKKTTLAIFTGDVIDRGGRSQEWDLFFTKSNIKTLTCALAVGNHEYYDDTPIPRTVGPEFFNLHTYNPQNGILPNTNYYFHYQNVLFVILNTEVHVSDMEKQAYWFNEITSKSQYDFLIVIGHKSFFGNQYYDQYPEPREQWMMLFKEKRVDIYFSGHDHVYTKTLFNNTYFITGGAAGKKTYPYHLNPPYNSNNKYHNLYYDLRYMAPHKDIYGIISVVNIKGNTLVLQTINYEGQELDCLEIIKRI